MPAPVITGTVKVGHALTASTGPITQTPTRVDYQWYADGRAVPDATGQQSGERRPQGRRDDRPGHRDPAGYAAASALSGTPSARVSADQAADSRSVRPAPALRRGQSTTLTWTVERADTARASGS